MFEDIHFIKPADIEKRSMAIIEETLIRSSGEEGADRSALLKRFSEEELAVVKRCIHTSADFDYAKNLRFSPGACEKGMEALKKGAHIVTDTTMAASGINKRALAAFGGQVHCFIGDEDVAREASKRGVTRSAVSMEKAAGLSVPLIFAIGNAPTALIRLYGLIREKKVAPALVIGVPVGFVNVVESKELMMKADRPYIIARGRKGGSNIAAAICNALLYAADKR